MVRQTCVVEVGQQLFFLHKPLIQPVSQGLCLHRNLFYWVHPEGKEGDKQTGSEMKHKKGWLKFYSAETACIDPSWKLQSKRSVSAAVPEQSSLIQTGIYYDSLCVCCSSSSLWGFISWQAHQSVRGRQKCWGGPWQETDKSHSSTKWLG